MTIDDIQEYRTCSQCGLSKAVSSFSKVSNSDLYRAACKSCTNSQGKKYAENNRQRNRSNPPDPSLPRTCTSCRETKTNRDFCNIITSSSGLSNLCKRCLQAKDKEWKDKNRKSYRERRRIDHIGRYYGLSVEKYDDMLKAQGGRCRICGEVMDNVGRKLSVDHDHRTGKVRSLLCTSCNSALGMAQDDIQIVESMVEYLKYWSGISGVSSE